MRSRFHNAAASRVGGSARDGQERGRRDAKRKPAHIPDQSLARLCEREAAEAPRSQQGEGFGATLDRGPMPSEGHPSIDPSIRT